MTKTEKYINPKELEIYIKALFVAAGMNNDNATFSASCMVKTNLWGIDSHGVLRMPIYLKRILSGGINANPTISPVSKFSGPTALLDGESGIGYVVGGAGMNLAIEKATKYGIGMILVRNSNHFGAAALYARQAVEAGFIGIATTNVVPNMGMKGNVKPTTGNNPMALAAPLEEKFPFVLDISSSSVAGGKLLLAAKKNEKIPKDWAVTQEGKETDDPTLGFAGFLLPMGLHKGFGLALFIDLLTGVLSGGPYLHGLKSMYKYVDVPSLVSHLFIAINPNIFLSKEEYSERVKDWAAQIHATKMVNPSEMQIIPGEIEFKNEQERIKKGIPIPIELINDLKSYSKKLKVEFPAVFH
jgi:LDH2 family malate/lactate/ureidoglycolate dehydrogenase